MNIQLAVYFIGVFVLGLFYNQLKLATGGGFWFVLTAIGYLLVLRLIGYGITRLIQARAASDKQ
ncbi:hypothetical protein [Pseudoxanthomonas putridarboris]|uniref:Uncharacterized protein n=1 Tax=Pseudoxanthomonas putridarboris TaxID=752605 RepID=A0ABU9J3M9_9GAMM